MGQVARVLWLLLTAGGCTPETERAPRAPAQRATNPAPMVHVLANGTRHTVRVEVVNDDEARARGLMHRKSMADDAGMLFLMGRRAVHGFWMKNTYLPLDIIFIDDDFRVVGVLERMKPLDENNRDIGKPSLYVLEVNAGWAAARGVGPGTLVQLEGIALP